MVLKSGALIGFALWGGILCAQGPAPAAVVNAASMVPSQLSNGSIAQGSIFLIYGSGMGASTLVQAGSFPLPTRAGLAGTSVEVIEGGVSLPAPLVYVSATQVAAIMPSGTPPGSATIAVSYNGQSGSIPVQVVAGSFGAFTINQTGVGPALITFPDYSSSDVFHSAKPGDTVTLWGTGLGAIGGDDAAAAVPVDLGTPLELFVGEQPATVTYRGRSSCCAGLDQINFVVPAGVAGCHVPVAVQVGNTVGSNVTMSISPGGKGCSDLNWGFWFGADAIANVLAQKKAVNMGDIEVRRVQGRGSTTAADSAGASFYAYPASRLLGDIGLAPLGACFVTSGFPYSVNPPGLNAGPSLQAYGPAASTVLTPNSVNQSSGSFSGQYAGFFAGSSLNSGSSYTVQNTIGGPDIGPFVAAITFPPLFTWNNFLSSNTDIPRSDPLFVTWTGGDPNGYVLIEGDSYVELSPYVIGTVFECVAPASAGQFTIPARVVQSMPVNMPGGAVLALTSTGVPRVVSAPGLDLVNIYAYMEIVRDVNFR